MIPIQADIFLLEGLRLSNAYLLILPEGLTLVDAGFMGEAERITEKLTRAGFSISDLHQLVLTHTHIDHIGSAAEIVRLTGARVLAHKDEIPYLERREAMPRHSLSQRLLFWLEEGLLAKPPPVKVDLSLEDGAVIPATGGFTAVHAPGHTPGSLCLYHPERRILICGDALFNKHPLTGKRGLIGPPALATSDTTQARQSVRKLAGLEVEILLCGHGKPILENAGEMIRSVGSDSV